MPYVDIDQRNLELTLIGAARAVYAYTKLLSVMEWPEDPVARERFMALLEERPMEQRVIDFGDPPFSDREFLLRRGPPGDPQAIFRERLKPVVKGAANTVGATEHTAGQVCGRILLIAFDMQRQGQSVSLTACLNCLSQKLTGKARSMNSRPEDLAKHWRALHSVAHFHAADMLMLIKRSRVVDAASLGEFLLLSEHCRNRGEAIKVRNSGFLLKNSETWKLPEAALLAAQMMADDAANRNGSQILT